jgi:ParB-like chromosome segregation protein Spo0J
VGQEYSRSQKGGVVTVDLDALSEANSPRLTGEDKEHTARLAETEEDLPPILVHRSTMTVIDGMHRLRAAVMKGHTTIDVIFFDGSEEEAFLRAVEENIRHGLPLTLTDRKAAAVRVIASHPEMSDRSIGHHVGLSDKTVGVVRRSTSEDPRLNTRVGKDGRSRPLNGEEGRRRAAEFIAAHPGAPLREIAANTGVSLGTAHDVRKRMRGGKDPLKGPTDALASRPATDRGVTITGQLDCGAILQRLLRDPALRYNERGQDLLRWLRSHAIATGEVSEMIDAVPAHCRSAVARLALQSAQAWQELANELESDEMSAYG